MPKKTKHEFDENIEGYLTDLIYTKEYEKAKTNQQGDIADFEAYVDMFDAERTEKEYDWMSDIFLPEFPSHMLTQSSIDVAQYFKTRDYVEVYVEDEGPRTAKAASATQECVNRTLNRRDLYYYQKYVRAKNINHLGGKAYAMAWWNKTKDAFDFDILDPRNVFTDNKYVYSLQQKSWVIVRGEKTLEELKEEEKQNGYFNLHLLEDVEPTGATETAKATTGADGGNTDPFQNDIDKNFDIYKRFGKAWCKTKKKKTVERDEADNIIASSEYTISLDEPGLDENGNPLKTAKLEEVVSTIAVTGGTKTLIGFHKTPYLDVNGNPYKPVIRGLCYIHPVRDGGVGDGKYDRELQIGINDTINLSNDRVLLATMPTMKGKKYATEETDSIYFEPGHLMELQDPKDVEEFKISSDILGAMTQYGVFKNSMEQTDSISPGAQGKLPDMASTTATAVAGAENRTNQRTNYKSMTFEFTFLTELYWMIQQMTWAFASPQTGFKLMGQKVYDFDPSLNYTYKPLSQSIETEYSKDSKIKNLMLIMQTVAQIQHPDAVVLFNNIFLKIATLMGDEEINVVNFMLGEDVPIQGGGGGGQQQGDQKQLGMGGAPSNQNGVPMGDQQAAVREQTYQ